ncbi:MAG TPA: carboxypeptidase-like regulatory domain-containing protein, partial [Chitinophagaceae bacterium]|nr:carboxypeptidase-like regulatory domain-containing protein [Chitinophagaceae bacterium]
MKPAIVIICILAFSVQVFSQVKGKSINGQVKDIQNEPLAGATIQLSKIGDSTIVQMIISRSNGKFAFNGLVNDTFVLSITFRGTKK